MSAATPLQELARKRGNPFSSLSRPYGDVKGLVLSHFLGLSFLFTFGFDRVIKENITGFYPTETPIRLIALWLLLDRNWRVGRVRLSLWDWAYLLIIFITGLGLIYNSLVPSLPISFEFYRRWVGEISKYYLAFLVVRESCHRVGFRPDIALNWFLLAMCYSAALGIAQSMDLFGLRKWSYDFYRMIIGMGMSGPTAARGTATHANSLAFELLVAMAVLVGRMFWRRPKLYEVGMLVLFIIALGTTQSRGGLTAFFAAAAGAVLYLMVNRRPGLGITIAGASAILAMFGLLLVELYNIERFKRVIYGETVTSAKGFGSFEARIQGRQAAGRIFERFPLFGSSPTSLFYFNRAVKYFSVYSSRQIVDGIYVRMLADAGIFGLIFVLVAIGYLLSFIRPRMATRPYAFAAFICGIAIATYGVAENFLVTRGVIIVSALVALSTVPAIVTERGRQSEQLSDELRSPWQHLH